MTGGIISYIWKGIQNLQSEEFCKQNRCFKKKREKKKKNKFTSQHSSSWCPAITLCTFNYLNATVCLLIVLRLCNLHVIF